MKTMQIRTAQSVETEDTFDPTSLRPWADSLELAIVVDTIGQIMEVNRAFARKFGRPTRSWRHESLAALIHPDDLPAHEAMADRLVRPPYHIQREHRWKTAQGWRWIAWEETALRNEFGEITATRAVGRDVTKHRLAEEHFRKISQAVEQAPVSVIITTPGGTPQYVNSRFTQATGYTLETVFENEIPLLRDGHPSEQSYRDCCAILANGGKWSGELKTRRRDGSEAWEFVQNSPIRNAAGEITNLLCLREDISERKALEEQLRHAQKMEDLGAMAGGIAHDFNNIISIVRGYSEMALALPQLDEQLERYMRSVYEAARRASALVEKIMLFSRKSDVRYRPVKVHSLAEEFIGFFTETFPRNIEFERDFQAPQDTIAADPDQLRQLFVNLCVNARDAMPEGGSITVSTRAVPAGSSRRPDLLSTQDYLRIGVSDTGCGMPEDVRRRIFEPFFTTKGESKGTGLGLAVVYGVVKNHDGVMEVLSEVGKGTEFEIFLPLRGSTEAASMPFDWNKGPTIPSGDERVLVVEDEEPIRELLSIALQESGYDVVVVSDGAEAADLILGGDDHFDAVMLDLNMPRMGGIEVLRLLSAGCLRVPVLVMSGHLTREVRRDLEQFSPAAVLAKPFDLGILGNSLRQVLDARKSES